MHQNQRRSMLCPNCRRLISGDDPVCPYCGLKHPTSVWQRLVGRGLHDGDQLLKILIGVNIAMFVLSLLFGARSAGYSMNPLTFLSHDSRSLLLLGAINNVRIPEEDEILQAIEEERARQAGETDDPAVGSEREGGDYVM